MKSIVHPPTCSSGAQTSEVAPVNKAVLQVLGEWGFGKFMHVYFLDSTCVPFDVKPMYLLQNRCLCWWANGRNILRRNFFVFLFLSYRSFFLFFSFFHILGGRECDWRGCGGNHEYRIYMSGWRLIDQVSRKVLCWEGQLGMINTNGSQSQKKSLSFIPQRWRVVSLVSKPWSLVFRSIIKAKERFNILYFLCFLCFLMVFLRDKIWLFLACSG